MITDVGSLVGGAPRNAPFKNSSSSACRPTSRSRAEMRAWWAWMVSAAAARRPRQRERAHDEHLRPLRAGEHVLNGGANLRLSVVANDAQLKRINRSAENVVRSSSSLRGRFCRILLR